MKKLAFLLAAVMGLSLVGCHQTEVVVDVHALAQALSEEVAYEDTLAPIDEQMAEMIYNLPDGIETAVIYMGSGATAEEVAVFAAEDEEAAKAMEEAAKKHIESQRDAFENYIPLEVQRLDEAVVERQGRYVAVCVTNDVDNAKAIMNTYWK